MVAGRSLGDCLWRTGIVAVHYLLGWAMGFFDWPDVCPTSTGSWRHWSMVSCSCAPAGSCVGTMAGVLARPCSSQGSHCRAGADPASHRDWLKPSIAMARRTAGWIELVIGVVASPGGSSRDALVNAVSDATVAAGWAWGHDLRRQFECTYLESLHRPHVVASVAPPHCMLNSLLSG